MSQSTTRIKTALLVLILTLVSCTKEQEEAFVPGEGESDLYRLNDYQGKEFSLKTGKEYLPGKPTQAMELDISDDYTELNRFGIVDYQTNAKLMSGIPFRGRENFEYKIRYMVTKDYLIVSKIAKREDLPSSEWTYAKEINTQGKCKAHDICEVPLIGYPISLISVRNKPNDLDEKTRWLYEVSVPDLAEASHFKMDFTSISHA